MKKVLLLLIFAIPATLLKAQWQPTNGPVPLLSTGVYALAAEGTSVFAGGSGIFLSPDIGVNWNKVNDETIDIDNVIAINGTKIFAGTRLKGVLLSTDNGTTWTASNNGLTNMDVSAFAFSGTTIYTGTQGGGVFKSTDAGANWTAVNNGLLSDSITALAVNGTTILAATVHAGIFLSTDNGSSWTAINNGLQNTYVMSLAVNDNKFFAGTDNGIFTSADNGVSWQPANNGLTGTNKFVRSLVVNYKIVFAGLDEGDGVFYSANNGTSWVPLNSGFTGGVQQHIYTLASNGMNLFAATKEGGVWRRPLLDVGAVKPYHQNSQIKIYPNPATNKVTITNNEALSNGTVVTIFNITGENVLSAQPENAQQFDVDVSSLAKGVYMVQLQMHHNVECKKLVIQ